MKNYLSIIVAVAIGVAVYAALSYFEMSFFWIVLALIPISYAQIFLTNRYNFRKSIQMEPLPQAGYESRIKRLDSNQADLAEMGFAKVDEFYMALSPDVLAYAYRHEQHPITLIDYNMHIMTFCDMVTQFDNGGILTTSNGGNAGVTPVPNEALLQVFPFGGYAELLRSHLEALEYLKPRGYQPSRLQSENYRPAFMRYYQHAGDYARGLLSPAKLIYRMASGQKKRYFRPVQQQASENSIELP